MNLRPPTTQELQHYEKLKKYKRNARFAIKDLQRQVALWREIALKHMALHRAAQTENIELNRQLYTLEKRLEGK